MLLVFAIKKQQKLLIDTGSSQTSNKESNNYFLWRNTAPWMSMWICMLVCYLRHGVFKNSRQAHKHLINIYWWMACLPPSCYYQVQTLLFCSSCFPYNFCFNLVCPQLKNYGYASCNIYCYFAFAPFFCKDHCWWLMVGKIKYIYINKKNKKQWLLSNMLLGQMMSQNGYILQGTRKIVDHISFNIYKQRSWGKNSSSFGPFMCHRTLMCRTARRPEVAERFISSVLAGMTSRG